MVDYYACFQEQLERIKKDGNYRTFINLERNPQSFPEILYHHQGHQHRVVSWCSNDYLGLSQHPKVIAAMHEALERYGTGAGGTRNISGSSIAHVALEDRLARLHNCEAALLFTSGYVSNLATLATLCARLPEAVVLSDAKNHASMIDGLRLGRAKKIIFRHNDPEDLEQKLKSLPSDCAKIIACESLYSMDGDIAPLKEFSALAQAYNAFFYLDEVHAVGLYGPDGAGIAAQYGIAQQIDIIEGTLAKAFGCIGGYIVGRRTVVDFVRSFASPFIFTTALPPVVVAGACASIDLIAAEPELVRRMHQNAASLRADFEKSGLPVMPTQSHILPLLVGCPWQCRAVARKLLEDCAIYVQPINYPTVPQGTERLRFTVSPAHNKEHRAALVRALNWVWDEFKLKRVQDTDHNRAMPTPKAKLPQSQLPASGSAGG